METAAAQTEFLHPRPADLSALQRRCRDFSCHLSLKLSTLSGTRSLPHSEGRSDWHANTHPFTIEAPLPRKLCARSASCVMELPEVWPRASLFPFPSCLLPGRLPNNPLWRNCPYPETCKPGLAFFLCSSHLIFSAAFDLVDSSGSPCYHLFIVLLLPHWPFLITPPLLPSVPYLAPKSAVLNQK